MMSPVLPSLNSDCDAIDRGRAASEAEIDDPMIDVVGVNHHAAALSADSMNSAGKKYHCQRCLNHSLEIPRKGHKRECRYANCQCDDCKLVEKRKILNREINSERERLANSPLAVASPNSNEKEFFDGPNGKVRNPRCARCRAHDPEKEPPPLKGHKKACRYKDCECKKCSLITSRRDVMARQIRLRRKQKSKTGSADSPNASQPVSVATDKVQQILRIPKEEQAHKVCVDLVTPPMSESTISPTNSDLGANGFDPIAASPLGHAVRPQPTYPFGSTQQTNPVECCSPNRVDYFNGGHLLSEFAAHQAPALSTLCPQSLFAGFLQYVQAIATAARAAPPGGGGLALPTMPAAVMVDPLGVGTVPPNCSPASLLAALSAARQPTDICVIPYCLPGSNGGAMQPLLHVAAHPQSCFLNDQHRLAALTTAFGQAPPPPRIFTLQ